MYCAHCRTHYTPEGFAQLPNPRRDIEMNLEYRECPCASPSNTITRLIVPEQITLSGVSFVLDDDDGHWYAEEEGLRLSAHRHGYRITHQAFHVEASTPGEAMARLKPCCTS
jgi:hypothetical protein